MRLQLLSVLVCACVLALFASALPGASAGCGGFRPFKSRKAAPVEAAPVSHGQAAPIEHRTVYLPAVLDVPQPAALSAGAVAVYDGRTWALVSTGGPVVPAGAGFRSREPFGSSCPGGVCPVPQNSERRGLFRAR